MIKIEKSPKFKKVAKKCFSKKCCSKILHKICIKKWSEYQKTHFRFENSNRDISATLWVKMSGESALESWDIKLFEKWEMRIYTYPTCVEYSKYAFKAIFQKEKVKIGIFRATSWHYDWFWCINVCWRCLETYEKSTGSVSITVLWIAHPPMSYRDLQ